jgi:hypothetical protein
LGGYHSYRLCVFILDIIIYRCAAGFKESVPAKAACVASSEEEEDGEADGESDGEADEGSDKAGEKRLCVYLFLIFACTLIF